MSLIVLRAASEVDKAIFFSALIIIAAFIPLFTLGGIEGRIFGPMSKTYAYAIVGALLATFTVTPALAASMLREDSEERDTLLVRGLRAGYRVLYGLAMRARALELRQAIVTALDVEPLNVTVWPDSLAGPVEMFVAKPGTV